MCDVKDSMTQLDHAMDMVVDEESALPKGVRKCNLVRVYTLLEVFRVWNWIYPKVPRNPLEA